MGALSTRLDFDLTDLVNRFDSSDERAGFTDADRQFLIDGGADLEAGTRNTRRARVRSRFREVLVDAVLLQNLPGEDIKQLFGGLFPSAIPPMDEDDHLVFVGIQGLFHVFFLGMGRELFFDALESGVERALFRSMILVHDVVPVVSVDVNFNLNGVAPLDELEKRFQNGEPLTVAALEGLVLTGRIDEDEFKAYSNITDDASELPMTIPEEWVEPDGD